MIRRDAGAILLGTLALLLLTTQAGGVVNGDIAVYLNQVANGDFSQRTIHLGYFLLIWVAQQLGGDGLELMTWVNAFAGVFIAGVVSSRLGTGRLLAWLILAAAVLPALSWAEVDLLWMALLIGAAYVTLDIVAAILVMLAVSVSPAALIALPISCGLRPGRWRVLFVGGALGIGLMSLAGGADWWLGDRGILAFNGVAPLRTLLQWTRWCPWILLPLVGSWLGVHRGALFYLPVLLLLPPDVPGWILPAVLIANGASRAWEADVHRRYLVAAATIHLVIGGLGWGRERVRVDAEAVIVEHVAASLEDGDRLSAPWSLGVRVSLAKTGEPYGLRWMANPRPVRDQQERFCELPGGRTAVLPPGVGPSRGTEFVDRYGVHWLTEGCRPNIVLVIGCTVRRDFMGAYGSSSTATPWLDALAARGARFEDLVAVAPWTKPSVAAVVTGQHPAKLGLVEPGAGRNLRSLDPGTETLAGYLSGAGYSAIGVSANPNVSARFGFSVGFRSYESLSPVWEQGVVKVDGASVVAAAIEALDASPTERPAYLQIVLADAHAPRDESGAGPTRAYQDALGAMDEALAALEKRLKQRAWTPENTIWIFVGDHGEGLDSPVEHGPGHGRYLYPSVVSVPWVMAGPGIKAGVRVGGLASHVDVAPTVLGLLHHELADAAGEDWSGLLREPEGQTSRQSAYSATWFLNTARAAVYTKDTVCQQDFGSGEQPEGRPAFNPGCYRRAGIDFGEAVEARGLMRRLERWWASQPQTEILSPGALDPNTDRHLRALGYLNEAFEKSP